MSVRVRIRKALVASLFGWIAGVIAGLPFQVTEAVGVAGPSGRLLVWDLGLAMALWLMLTFAVALYFCAIFLLPIAWLVPAEWIVRNRRGWIAGSTCFGIAIMALRTHVWTSLDHDGVSLVNFWMWAANGASFCFAASALYARFLRGAQVHG